MLKLDELGLQINSPLAKPTAANFRPPSWPPPPDWAPVLDKDGVAVCLYKDPIWQLRSWGAKPKQLNFGDGPQARASRIDPANADLLRLLVTWRIWGPRGARTVGSIKNFYDPLRAIVALCSREGILASDLSRFPAIIDKVPNCLPRAKFDFAISALHDILDAEDPLGFKILDRHDLAWLAKSRPEHIPEQTPFIPPRIWAYQVSRLRQCLDEFSKHREQIESCFAYACDAYADSYGSLTASYRRAAGVFRTPFQGKRNLALHSQSSSRGFGEPFRLTEEHFGLQELFDKWIGKDDGKRTLGIVRLSKYLTLISLVGLKYLLNFSLMRINEAWNLRADCLIVEADEKLGDIYLICGETTKTDPDADARWPTSSSTKVAIEAMTTVARLRMTCAKENPFLELSHDEISNPYLLGPSHEPWSNDGGRGHAGKKDRQSYQSYLVYIAQFPCLLDNNSLKVNETDLQLARLIEPNLNEDKYQIGKVWPLAFHQLRRTGVINMLSSGMVSEPSVQHQLKHAARAMSMYYGHNYGRLSLDSETRRLYLTAMYRALGAELAQLVSSRFVSPHGSARKEQITAFISIADSKMLEEAGRRGEVSARRIRLGFCMKRDTCTYGGIESIAHCGGGDTGTACNEVLYDKEKHEQNNVYGLDLDRRIAATPYGSPRYYALLAEKKSLENYNVAIQ